MISILVNSRYQGYENKGDINKFLISLRSSLHSKKNVEIIFKLDLDDKECFERLSNINSDHSDLNIKYVITPRYYYKGLHLGYKDCFYLTDKNSKIITCMADDFYFEKTGWDKELLELTEHFEAKDLFAVQDFISKTPEQVPISPMWSRKLIEILDGFGPVFATDAWSMDICNYLMQIDKSKVIIYDIQTKRHLCKMDTPSDKRWYTDRNEAITYLKSVEYLEYLQNDMSKIDNYLNLFARQS